jgi:hypothetical protein
LRIADTRDLVAATTKRDTAKHIALCSSPKPEERSRILAFFGLNCVAFDEKKRITDDKGTPWIGLIIAVYTPKGSSTDTFLNKKREKGVVYVWLEDAGR